MSFSAAFEKDLSPGLRKNRFKGDDIAALLVGQKEEAKALNQCSCTDNLHDLAEPDSFLLPHDITTRRVSEGRLVYSPRDRPFRKFSYQDIVMLWNLAEHISEMLPPDQVLTGLKMPRRYCTNVL